MATKLSVSDAAVYRALREGQLPGAKVLGCWRVDPDELKAWIDAQKPAPVAVEPRDLLDEVYELRRG